MSYKRVHFIATLITSTKGSLQQLFRSLRGRITKDFRQVSLHYTAVNHCPLMYHIASTGLTIQYSTPEYYKNILKLTFQDYG